MQPCKYIDRTQQSSRHIYIPVEVSLNFRLRDTSATIYALGTKVLMRFAGAERRRDSSRCTSENEREREREHSARLLKSSSCSKPLPPCLHCPPRLFCRAHASRFQTSLMPKLFAFSRTVELCSDQFLCSSGSEKSCTHFVVKRIFACTFITWQEFHDQRTICKTDLVFFASLI